jgi:hypothetical protein
MKNAFATIIGTSVLTAGIVSMSALSASAAGFVFSGNDSNDPNLFSNLDTSFGDYDWSQWGKSDEGAFNAGSGKSGSVTIAGLEGISGAIAVKAGTQYKLVEVLNLGSFTWDTVGLTNNGANQPNLSHITIFTRPGGGNQQEVPEPLTLLGSGLALGFGGYFQKKRNAKKSA